MRIRLAATANWKNKNKKQGNGLFHNYIQAISSWRSIHCFFLWHQSIIWIFTYWASFIAKLKSNFDLHHTQSIIKFLNHSCPQEINNDTNKTPFVTSYSSYHIDRLDHTCCHHSRKPSIHKRLCCFPNRWGGVLLLRGWHLASLLCYFYFFLKKRVHLSQV